MAPDDETWEDDPLVRALRAPGTPEELAGGPALLAAFHAAHDPTRSGRRLVGRLGIGATSAVTAVVLSAGVAAAYTRALPEPVQRIAHGVLGPVGVPGPERQAPEPRTPVAQDTPTPTTTTPGPAASPTRSPGPGKPSAGATRRPTAAPSTATPAPPPSTDPTPTATPTDGPTSGTTAPPRVPSAVSVAVASGRVPVAGTTEVSGVVTAEDGKPLRHRTVRFGARPVGGSWSRVATARTDRAGRVTFTSPALERTTRFRLTTGNGVVSAVVTVVVVPSLAAAVTEQDGSSTVTVTATGGRPGDRVTAFRRKDGRLVRIGTYQLAPDGTAVVTVPTPTRQVRLVLRLSATAQHASAQTAVTIGR